MEPSSGSKQLSDHEQIVLLLNQIVIELRDMNARADKMEAKVENNSEAMDVYMNLLEKTLPKHLRDALRGLNGK